MTNKRQQIIDSIINVTELPTQAGQILALINDPDFQIKELEKAITTSPSLSAMLLRLSNSVFFSGSRSISSVHQAIMRLGARKIYEIVLATSTGQMASKELKGYGLPPGELWKKMVLTAFVTIELADILEIDVPDHTFTAALLHGIGKILLGSVLEVDADPILETAKRDSIPFHESEEKILGINHAEAGAILLDKWQLPPEIVFAVRHYNEPSAAEKNDIVTDLIHLSAYAIHMIGIGAGVDELKYRPDDEVLNRYKIRIKKLETAISKGTIRADEMLENLSGLMETK